MQRKWERVPLPSARRPPRPAPVSPGRSLGPTGSWGAGKRLRRGGLAGSYTPAREAGGRGPGARREAGGGPARAAPRPVLPPARGLPGRAARASGPGSRSCDVTRAARRPGLLTAAARGAGSAGPARPPAAARVAAPPPASPRAVGTEPPPAGRGREPAPRRPAQRLCRPAGRGRRGVRALCSSRARRYTGAGPSDAVSPRSSRRGGRAPGCKAPAPSSALGMPSSAPRGGRPAPATRRHPPRRALPDTPRARDGPAPRLPPPQGKKIGGGQWEAGKARDVAGRRAARCLETRRRAPRPRARPAAAPAPPPRRAAYKGRGRAGRRVPAVRELPWAPRRGRLGTGRAAAPSLLAWPRAALRAPRARPRRSPRPFSPGPLPAPPRPLPLLGVAGARRGARASLGAPACPADAAGPTNMSTTLLSAFYDIDFLCKVRGEPFAVSDPPSGLGSWGNPPHPDFLGAGEKSRSLQQLR